MRPHGVHVAPSTLDRIVEKYAAPAARFEQAVDGVHTPIDGLARIPAVAGARGQRYFRAGTSKAHHLREIAEHPVASRADLGGSFRQAVLHERVLDDTRLIADIDPSAGLLAKSLERAERRADS